MRLIAFVLFVGLAPLNPAADPLTEARLRWLKVMSAEAIEQFEKLLPN